MEIAKNDMGSIKKARFLIGLSDISKCKRQCLKCDKKFESNAYRLCKICRYVIKRKSFLETMK